jgi:hypothetical protein
MNYYPQKGKYMGGKKKEVWRTFLQQQQAEKRITASASPVRVSKDQPPPDPDPPDSSEGGLDITDPARRQRLRLPAGVDIEDLYRTATLLEAMVFFPSAPSHLKDLMFPRTTTTIADNVWLDYFRGNQKLAPFVHALSKGSVVDRDRYRSNAFRPPHLKPIKVLHSDDLHNRAPGVMTGEEAAALLTLDLADLDRRITRTEEWMSSCVLFQGRVPILDYDTGRRLQILDYGDPSTTVVAPAWTDPDSKPLDDLKAAFRGIGGQANMVANIAVFGSQAADLFEANESVQQMYNKYMIDVGRLTPRMQEWGIQSLGNYRGVELQINETTYVDKEGNTQPYVPPNVVLIACSEGAGSFAYAGVAQKGDDNRDLSVFEGTRIPKIWFPDDSDVRKVRLGSRPCPLPAFMEAWSVMVVAPAP